MNPLQPSPKPAVAAPAAAPSFGGKRWFERIAAWPRWQWFTVAFLICFLLPPFFSWPRLPWQPERIAELERGYQTVVERKVAHPLYDYTKEFSPETNEAKRNFRLTMPLVGYLTGTGFTGIHVVRYALHGVLLLGLLLAAERAGADRLTGLCAALAIAGTYVGTSVWRDTAFFFDNCAQAFVVLMLLARHPALIISLGLLAGFTDERALLALPLVYLFHRFTGSFVRTHWAVGAVALVYLAIRMALASAMQGLPPGKGIGDAHIWITNLQVLWLSTWFALEGGWLIVGFVVLPRGMTGAPRDALLLALATLIPIGAAMAVGDFTRSATYAFPAVLVALALIRRGAKDVEIHGPLHRAAFYGAVLSLLVPNMMVMGTLMLEQSIPVRTLIRWLGGTI